MTTLDIHPWEKAGLGVAPFRFVGMSEKVYVAAPGCPEQPAGTCDYCGNGIRYVYHVESADGRRFGVGCDCIRKLDRECLVNATDFERQVAAQKRKLRQAQTAARRAKDEARIAAAFALIDSRPDIQQAFAARPHPFEAMAKEGQTFADYVDWMRRMAGVSGGLKIAREIEKAATR